MNKSTRDQVNKGALMGAAENEKQIGIIQETLKWHTLIGGAAIAAAVTVAWTFISWYLPKELSTQKTEIVNEVQLRIDQIAKLQLDKLSTQVTAAQNDKVKSSSESVRRLGSDALQLANSRNPEISERAWLAVNQLAGYYSFVNQVDPAFIAEIEKRAGVLRWDDRNTPCLAPRPAQPGRTPSIRFNTVIFENCTLRLNTALEEMAVFENTLFRNVTVIYEGGHVQLYNVAFVNCIFHLPFTTPARKLGETLIATNQIDRLELP
jgi:hypothetical protein